MHWERGQISTPNRPKKEHWFQFINVYRPTFNNVRCVICCRWHHLLACGAHTFSHRWNRSNDIWHQTHTVLENALPQLKFQQNPWSIFPQISAAKKMLFAPVAREADFEYGAKFWCYFCEEQCEKHKIVEMTTVLVAGLLEHVARWET